MKHTRRPNVSLITETGCSYEFNSPHKWWSTINSCGIRLGPWLASEEGGLVCESVSKADMLSDHFDSKLSREAVEFCSLAIRLLVLPPLRSGPVR